MKENPLFLSIETAGHACSVALLSGRKTTESRHEVKASYIHAERLLPLIDEVLEAAGKTPKDLNAIIVSAGPGSYTGLRIGVSTGKGLCHALRIPLIAMDTLESLSVQARQISTTSWDAIVCVLDARRDEVYTATFAPLSNEWTKVQPTRALVIDSTAPLEQLFPDAAQGKNVVVIGDAAQKTQRLLGEKARLWTFLEEHPRAVDAGPSAEIKFAAKEFEDVAYFEPLYLKEFIAGTPKDPLGLRQNSIDTHPPA